MGILRVFMESGCARKFSRRGYLLLASALILAACDEYDDTTNRVAFVYGRHVDFFNAHLNERFRQNSYQWAFHIHFEPNDYGRLSGEKQQDLVKPNRVAAYFSEKNPPFTKDQMRFSDDEAPLLVNTSYEDRRILGTLSYRHTDFHKAGAAFKNLFRCKNGHSEALDKIFLFGSGGSHGGDALRMFGRYIKQECGKQFDFALLMDPIEQPAYFSLKKFDGLAPGAACLSMYQHESIFIKGDPVSPCVNIRITGNGHDQVAGQAGVSVDFPSQFLYSIAFDADGEDPLAGISYFTPKKDEWNVLYRAVQSANDDLIEAAAYRAAYLEPMQSLPLLEVVAADPRSSFNFLQNVLIALEKTFIYHRVDVHLYAPQILSVLRSIIQRGRLVGNVFRQSLRYGSESLPLYRWALQEQGDTSLATAAVQWGNLLSEDAGREVLKMGLMHSDQEVFDIALDCVKSRIEVLGSIESQILYSFLWSNLPEERKIKIRFLYSRANTPHD